uniref:MENTAL domain-containing protein n=1 Tax=Kalanchoe fedtschenkoi TaxID=63787 RepID=A0A7N0TT93_KALFE
MGFFKDEKANKAVRIAKTLFFLISMAISFLIFSAPLLLVIADTLLPSAILSASMHPNSLTLQTISSLLSQYDFRRSLIDVPLISVIRSAVIIFVYSLCDGPKLSRGPYMATTAMLSVASLIFVSMKAPFVFSSAGRLEKGAYCRALEVALFVSSLGLAVAHVIVAYRISCRERRKLLVYRIDIEAVLGGKIGFSSNRYQKLLLEERLK